MKRYYTDPLAAAFMSREFGVELNKYVTTPASAKGIGYTSFKKAPYKSAVRDELYSKTRKYYIHPDSYHIFEPQAGDVGFDRGCTAACHVRIINERRWCFDSDPQGWPMCDGFKIIQRDNKPFFWPKEEL